MESKEMPITVARQRACCLAEHSKVTCVLIAW
jgi:hypothetical protein